MDYQMNIEVFTKAIDASSSKLKISSKALMYLNKEMIMKRSIDEEFQIIKKSVNENLTINE
eukprot:CAMPEP_0170551174 /NCGR_PEP_ID=MMETSP0211-20121228/9203_1 /TAXON_ID=311385 /ORGANISM="Pseudokeronopsis sp., Strain OXSARD2" /LENGTH=60 /DNA_ID=CAMNT_0010858181 /DNA_START=941 /DNA_END=1123 /DNA_ORIENTATION=+